MIVADIVDQLSEGMMTMKCPYTTCNETRTDSDPTMANALINNHIRRDHPLEEE